MYVLKAFVETIFTCGIIPAPKASIHNHYGTEFKSVIDQYIFNSNMPHLWALSNRHKQKDNVGNSNNLVGRILMTYLQSNNFINWTDRGGCKDRDVRQSFQN